MLATKPANWVVLVMTGNSSSAWMLKNEREALTLSDLSSCNLATLVLDLQTAAR